MAFFPSLYLASTLDIQSKTKLVVLLGDGKKRIEMVGVLDNKTFFLSAGFLPIAGKRNLEF